MPFKRRHHNKSRGGCSQCKARKIKCNEARPTCSNCERRQITCDFSKTSDIDDDTPDGDPADVDGPEPSAQGTSVTSSGFISPSTDISDFISECPELNADDQELLQHYTTSAYKTLDNGANGDYTALWRVHAVREAFKHDFLLRSILTVSALHLAYLQPQSRNRYQALADVHYFASLQSVRPLIPNTTDSNCIAVFLFSCFAVIMSFADGRWTQDEDFTGGIVNILGLLRGCNSVLQLHWPYLKSSFVGGLLEEGSQHSVIPTHEMPDVHHFAALFTLSSTPPLHDVETKIANTLAVHELLKAATQTSLLRSRGMAPTLAIFAWPHALPEKYVSHLGAGQSECLIILAHYAVLLRWANTEWYLEGLAEHLLRNIRNALPKVWWQYLMWPESVIEGKGSGSV